MIIAQRGGVQSRYDYSKFHAPRNNAVLRFTIERSANPQTPGRWLADPKEYAVGFGATQRNASGGIGFACDGTLWTSGDALRDNPVYADRLSTGGPSLVHGLQGLNISQTKSTGALPWKGMFIDFDGNFGDSNAAGHIGDVEVFQRCEGNLVKGNLLEGKYVEGPSVYVPQDYPLISCPDSPYDLRERLLAGTIATTQNSSIAPAFGCTPALTGAPQDCSVNINLAAGQSRAHNLKIKVPDGLPTGHRGVNCTVLSPAGQTSSVNVARIADQVSSGKFAANSDGYACWQFTIAGPEELVQNQQNLGQRPPPEESNLLCRNGMQLSDEGACQHPANRPWNGLYCDGTSQTEPQANACGSGMQLSQDGVCRCPSNRPWNGLYCGGTPNSQQINEAPEHHVEIPPRDKRPRLSPGHGLHVRAWLQLSDQSPMERILLRRHSSSYFTDDPRGSNVDDDKNTPHQAQFSPPNLSISKALAQRICKAGKKCTYQVRIKNSSFAPFSGPFEISDQISLRDARLVSVSPRRWSCSGSSGRYTCRNPQVRLNAGAATQLLLTFALSTKARGQIKNCAAIVWRSTTQKRLRTIAVQQALGRLGYKVGGVNGAYGSATARAISQYQRRNKLPTVSGINQKLLSQLFVR